MTRAYKTHQPTRTAPHWSRDAVWVAMVLSAVCLGLVFITQARADVSRVAQRNPHSSKHRAERPRKPSSPTVTADVTEQAILETDFADPYVLVTSQGYYAYSTSSGSQNVPVMHSTDLVHWSASEDAAPSLPSWITAGTQTWAPSVVVLNGRYVLYLSVLNAGTNTHCIVAASSAAPGGPFEVASAPLVCGDGGAIDASPFTDSEGGHWLTWKFEATLAQPSSIVSQRLADDGFSLEDEPTRLVSPTTTWEGGNVEGPTISFSDGAYWLLYSAGDWSKGTYVTGYARCSSPSGPCVKASEPFLTSAGGLPGPGGAELFNVHGKSYIAFHVWDNAIGYPNGHRVPEIRQINFSSGVPHLN